MQLFIKRVQRLTSRKGDYVHFYFTKIFEPFKNFFLFYIFLKINKYENKNIDLNIFKATTELEKLNRNLKYTFKFDQK